MSGDIVNLRLARKAARRTAAAETGAANRAIYGRTRAAREGEARDRDRVARHLDGHRREEPRFDAQRTADGVGDETP